MRKALTAIMAATFLKVEQLFLEHDPVVVWIGLGANLGHPIEQLVEARRYLAQQLDILAVSSLYRSAPIDCPTPQNDYFNAVMCAQTDFSPHALLQCLLDIERSMGRTREGYHSPRTLDLDLLIYGSLRQKDSILTLPHPAMVQRAFVLKPMNELVPDLVLENRYTVREALLKVADQALELHVCEGWQPQLFRDIGLR